MKWQKALPAARRGYTLIEILVGLTIISLLFSFGYVSFREFSRRQALAGSVKKMQGDLRLAQSFASSGQKPNNTTCNNGRLDSYGFTVIVSPPGYKIEANCGAAFVYKTVTLPSDVTVTVPSIPLTNPTVEINPILFKALGQGTNIPSGQSVLITLTQVGTGSTSSVTVTSGGEIK